jgi:hypothetical protein
MLSEDYASFLSPLIFFVQQLSLHFDYHDIICIQLQIKSQKEKYLEEIYLFLFQEWHLIVILAKLILLNQKQPVVYRANFFVEYFGNHANGHVLWPDPFFPVNDLLKTVTDLLVTTAPKKSPTGTALPVHYIP